jgi:predicted DNA-binding protein YlxM (UPF0122 family)
MRDCIHWNSQLNTLLRYYWGSRLSIAQIAEQFGTTYQSITSQARVLNLPRKKTAKRKWTPELCDKFRRAWERNRTCADVAKAMGMSEMACYAQASIMRLPYRTKTGPRRGAKPRLWTADEYTRALSLWDLGKSGSEIARELGRTRNSVIGKIHRITSNCDKSNSNYVPRAAG